MAGSRFSTLKLAAALAGGFAIFSVLRTRGRRSFRNKVVLITGGSRGLGLDLARRFGVQGAKVVLVARDEAELGRAASELASGGVDVRTFVADVREASAAEAVVNGTIEAFGGIDVLVNNAGIITVGPLESMSWEDYEDSFATHVCGPLRLMLAALPHLKKRKGRVINISSIGGKIAVPHLAPYTVSKFALAGLSDAFRAELAKDGVAVTTVFPGLMRTGSHLRALFKGQRAKEFAWFSLGSATPLSSAASERAARQIIRASRLRRPELVITIQARLAIIANAIFPNLTARVLAMLNRFLPTGTRSGPALPGYKCRGKFPPESFTILPDRASVTHNELG